MRDVRKRNPIATVLLLASLCEPADYSPPDSGKKPKFAGCKIRSMHSGLVFLSGVFTPVR